MSGRAFQAAGAPGPSPEARALGVGWGDIEAGTDRAGLVDLVLTLAFTVRDVGSHWGGRTGRLSSVLKAYIYSHKPSIQMVKPRLRQVR